MGRGWGEAKRFQLNVFIHDVAPSAVAIAVSTLMIV